MKFSVMRYICSGAVLQYGEENIVFGYADSNASVTLEIVFEGKVLMSLSAQANKDGKWSVTLPSFEGGFNSYTLKFTCGDESFTAENVLFGEVYHISGQSNMELPMSRTYDPFKPFEHEESDYIREFRVPVECCFDGSLEEEDFRGGSWLTAKGGELLDMSGAGYYFALILLKKLNMPIGLLNTSAGGSAVEGRMPRSMLEELGGYEQLLEAYSKPDYMERTAADDMAREKRWYEELSKADGISDRVFDEGFEFDSKCSIPFYFREVQELSGFSGRVWFKRTFEIPENIPLSDAELILGAIIDADRAYINGTEVGVTYYMYPPRIYRFDAGLLRYGSNTVHVCVDIKNGKGGFVRGKNYCLKLGGSVIDLSGEWEYSAVRMNELAPAVFFPDRPLAVYSTLTSPAFNINVRGMLWYQGETNAGNAARYPELFARFAEMYRTRCGKDIPIIFAQLPNFRDPISDEIDYSWAEFRLAQKKCLEIPNTAMAVTIGCGESNDLHPIDKKTVGQRLAYCTLSLVYGQKAPEYSECAAAEYRDGAVQLTFTGPEIVLENDPPKYFEAVYGERIVKLSAVKTASDTLSLPCESAPDFVRYAFDNDPAEPDIFNADGLPCSPFVMAVSK